ncbi:MAG: DUF3810 domain-containing protein [Lachnospiraceae bacterium]|nr:DUF3810 domain-containing protein [Lachnospiraceae bacterium]
MKKKETRVGRFFRLCPVRHCIVILSGLLVAFHFLTRNDRALCAKVSDSFVRHVHVALAKVFSVFPFSGAEFLIYGAVLFALIYLIVQIVLLIRRPEKGKRAWRALMTFAALGLAVWGLFGLLWGTYYYGDDFAAKSGMKQENVTPEQLAAVTEYFADVVNTYAPQVARDDRGICAIDKKSVLERSAHLYDNVRQTYPFLYGPDVPVKALTVLGSKIQTHANYTGFFFPLTGEANVNTDFPSTQFAATVAHELAHQRGVAKEQEANFMAVVASFASGDPDFTYSSAVMAFVYCHNALYEADRDAHARIWGLLCEEAKLDLENDRLYWEPYQENNPVKEVTDAVYEDFLEGYGQELGLKSYGACVDYLVSYFYEDAAAHLGLGE